MKQDLQNLLDLLASEGDCVIKAATEAVKEKYTAKAICQILKLLDNRPTERLKIIIYSLQTEIVCDALIEQLYCIAYENPYVFTQDENLNLLKSYVGSMTYSGQTFSHYQETIFINMLEALIARNVPLKDETVYFLRGLEKNLPCVECSEDMPRIKMAIALYGSCDINKRDMAQKLDDIVVYIKKKQVECFERCHAFLSR